MATDAGHKDWRTESLTERQRELLAELPYDAWVRPMDVGGHSGSHHSATLRQLVLKGYAQRRGWRSYKYRRAPDTDRLVAHTRLLASYGCVEQGIDAPCGECGPCEASTYLMSVRLR